MTPTETQTLCGCATWPHEIRHAGHVTVRPSNAAERNEGFGWNPLTPQDKRTPETLQRARKYLVVDYDNPESVIFVFFMPETADTKEEIVFWAERFCSKNSYGFIRPAGFEGIKGALPDDEDEPRPKKPVPLAPGEKMHAFSGWSTPDGRPPSSGF